MRLNCFQHFTNREKKTLNILFYIIEEKYFSLIPT